MVRKKILINLQNRFDRQAIKQLRDEIENLGHKVDDLEFQLDHAQQSADFWQDHATDMQQALADENFSTHRQVGINKAGELMVVRTDIQFPGSDN